MSLVSRLKKLEENTLPKTSANPDFTGLTTKELLILADFYKQFPTDKAEKQAPAQLQRQVKTLLEKVIW